ncbi:MAG: hypothetical protein HYV66_00070 [Candidatus Sungbacteria bacterium]|uniref:Uncharacterized protein n=1 Tax=Candidatus Sungiibacteriota bacterium TaxID=2750080 RepID=A0A931YCZ6_9BACT|nr:hypothetical protein [Candidatus Sungbacteria bacterium]
MSKIQELLKNKSDQIDYKEIIKKFPWIIEKGQDCILSPDSDGLLCGLFMGHFLGWKIKGFYDGKVMLLDKNVSASECVFLDMEVFRKDIRSVGHHMVQYNKNKKPTNWDNYKNCIQPNNLRDYDGYREFRLKYPLATIHLLIGIIGSSRKIIIPESAICPLLFTDGTFNVLFKYPENVLNWLNYLRAGENSNPLKLVFENEKYSVFSLMKAMDDFFKKRDDISIVNERGDRLRISEVDGSPVNIVKQNYFYSIEADTKERSVKFIKLLSTLTGWKYTENLWSWSDLILYKFTKKDFASGGISLNNKNFDELMSKKPLTWAMTTGQNIEYTLEKPDHL